MNPGRNDPCPCGSGKKFKHCCLLANVEPVADLAQHAWRRMRDALDNFAADMLDFTLTTYGGASLGEAWFEFTLGEREAFTAGHPESGLFFPWFFHRWAPHAAGHGKPLADAGLQGVAPGRAYLERKGKQIHPLRRRYVEACLAAPFGFFEILNCQKGTGFTARDVFTGQESRVFDRAASAELKKGDILYGQLVQLQGFAMMEAVSPIAFPPAFKTSLLQVKHRTELQAHPDAALRGIYHTLAEKYLNPRLPEIHNTDGDVMELRTLYFDVESPWAAFDALKSLALGMSEEDLLAEAKRDAHGRVSEAMIPWIRKANPKQSALQTVLIAHLRIAGRKLTAEVNSAQRARAVRELIAEKLGAGAKYRRTRKKPLESLLPTPMPGEERRLIPRNAEEEELLQSPEVRAHIDAFQRKHYETWPEIPLPALQGRTPLEAVKDPVGREMVEALILQFERDAEELDTRTPADVFAELRKRLGL